MACLHLGLSESLVHVSPDENELPEARPHGSAVLGRDAGRLEEFVELGDDVPLGGLEGLAHDLAQLCLDEGREAVEAAALAVAPKESTHLPDAVHAAHLVNLLQQADLGQGRSSLGVAHDEILNAALEAGGEADVAFICDLPLGPLDELLVERNPLAREGDDLGIVLNATASLENGRESGSVGIPVREAQENLLKASIRDALGPQLGPLPFVSQPGVCKGSQLRSSTHEVGYPRGLDDSQRTQVVGLAISVKVLRKHVLWHKDGPYLESQE